jgi:hypothetical protein
VEDKDAVGMDTKADNPVGDRFGPIAIEGGVTGAVADDPAAGT